MSKALSPTGHAPATIECETAVRRLWDYVDGRLPMLASEEVRAHLAACILCAPRFAFARDMKEALGHLGEAEALARLDDEERRSLQARIREILLRGKESDGS